MPLPSQKLTAAYNWFLITPHDTNIVAEVRALYVGVGGNLVLQDADGTEVTFTVPAGAVLPVSPRRVLATGTLADNIIGLV